jgi:DNA polymerase-3 subunit gamma/tau
MPVLARAWQMLLKGIEEVQAAPVSAQAGAMVLIRLAYVADLPVPAELVRALTPQDAGKSGAEFQPPVSAPSYAAPSTPSPPSGERAGVRGQSTELSPVSSPGSAPGQAFSRVTGEGPTPAHTAPQAATRIDAATPAPDPPPQSFAEIVALFERRREMLLRSHLISHVHLVSFEPGRIEFRPAESAPRDLANRLGQLLGEWTGIRWVVAVSQEAGAPTLATQEAARESLLRNEVVAHPLVRAVLEAFPGATIASVRDRVAAADPGADDSDAEAGDDFGEDSADTGEDG